MTIVVMASLVAPLAARAETFPRPSELEPNIAFWRAIFATYSENQVVVHDDWYLDKVYEVLDFRSWAGEDGHLDPEAARLREARVKAVKDEYQDILRRLHSRQGSSERLDPTERRVQEMFADVDGASKYLQAVDRVRTQSGLRERFQAGLARQRGYLPAMQAILKERGVPPQLAHLTLVESCFDLDAYSKVGAAGVWQFMPSTGKQYLTIDASVDERRDPLRSTEAAAEHLQGDYDVLGTWPLAITAYNHGRGGLARAVRTVGTTDFGEIVTSYRGPAFGFASRNFYAEFLAALEVVGRSKELFGEVRAVSAPRSREVQLRGASYLHDAARQAGVSPDALIAMNPAFLPRVIDGRGAIPRGYQLRVPVSSSDVELAVAHAPLRRASSRPTASRSSTSRSSTQSSYRVHKVQPGQTLQTIARRYGTTVKKLQGLNNLSKPRTLQAGQRLRVPANG